MDSFLLNATILIVDDSIIIRRHLSAILKKTGMRNIHFAEDGAVALREIKTRVYDLIMLDWNMPHVSGIDALRSLRSDEATSKIPVIMVTGEALRENIIAAVQAGANDYIVKPYTEEGVLHKVRSVLKQKCRA
ncbi:MAG: response regulator [Nitrospinae bacterium]|nr:response regulator [Nitrospinota bacterium]